MVEHVVVALLKERDIRPVGGDGMWSDEARVGDIHSKRIYKDNTNNLRGNQHPAALMEIDF